MKNTLTTLRALALARLVQYRKYRNFLKEQAVNLRAANAPSERSAYRAVRTTDPSARELTVMRDWVHAIDRIRAKLSAENALKARFMDRCFGLEAVSSLPRSQRARIIALTMDLHISESTAYRWREEILDLVLFSAIESGVLRPFDGQTTGNNSIS